MLHSGMLPQAEQLVQDMRGNYNDDVSSINPCFNHLHTKLVCPLPRKYTAFWTNFSISKQIKVLALRLQCYAQISINSLVAIKRVAYVSSTSSRRWKKSASF